MSNGAAPPTVPGSSQPVSGAIAQPDPSTEAPYLPANPDPAAAAEPAIPTTVQQELDQLRGIRDQVAPLMPLVDQLGGEGLYQHYSQYAQMLQQQQNQPTPPAAAADSQGDLWGETPEQEPSYVQELRTQLKQQGTQLQQMTHSVGVDKVAAHSDKFFREEFPDMTPDERKTVNDGMGRVFRDYSSSEQGRSFLQNPQYAAVRALAINQVPPAMLEELYRRRFERERTTRSRLSTDAHRPVQPGGEEVDMGEDGDFLTAWLGSAEKVRREGGA